MASFRCNIVYPPIATLLHNLDTPCWTDATGNPLSPNEVLSHPEIHPALFRKIQKASLHTPVLVREVNCTVLDNMESLARTVHQKELWVRCRPVDETLYQKVQRDPLQEIKP